MNAYSSEWIPDRGGGSISLSGEISTDAGFGAATAKGRRAERVEVAFGAGLRQRGASGVTVQILDLSTDGFRVATHLELMIGTDVWLRLPGLEPSHARVVWSDAQFIGCAFVRPLHPAVVDMLVARTKGR
ncbi:MAG: PilZ domain-containing protein [Allosphingosinicella sp.]